MSKMAKITYAGLGMHAQKGQKHIVIFLEHVCTKALTLCLTLVG